MRIPKTLLLAVIVVTAVFLLAIFAYGVSAQRYRIFPYAYFNDVETALSWFWERRPGGAPWYYIPTDRTEITRGSLAVEESPDLNLVTAMGPADTTVIKVVDMAGNTVHEWPVDWFAIWPDPDHVRFDDQPKSRPGGHIHGITLLDDGSIVFNFENLSMVRMGLCGDVIWKLPYRTHHSVFVDEDGNIWAPAQRFHEEKLPGYPNHTLPVSESMIIKVSPDGEVLREISMFDWFDQRGLRAWLHMGADKKSNVVSGDTLHVNDVEIFPSGMNSELFAAGDIMVSLRDLHSVLILDKETLDAKYWKTGGMVRQHDPDFIGADQISIYDNNHVGPNNGTQQSRIVVENVTTGRLLTAYTGNVADRFYSKIMGKHQWLPNGHLLITDSMSGRAIEIDEDGGLVWEYVNLVAEGTAGIMEEVVRLPAHQRDLFADGVCTNYRSAD